LCARRLSVFLFGAYGRRNTGDDAMLYALLRELYTRNSEVSFKVLAEESVIVVPEEVKRNIQLVKPSTPIVLKEVLKSSGFMIGGGTHFHDYGVNKLRWIKVTFKIFILILMSKIFRKYVFLVANGFGPLTSFLSKFLLKLICLFSDFISVRDKISYEVIRSLVKKNIFLTFDPTILLEPHLKTNPVKKTKDRKILGISILPVFKLFFENKEMDCLLVKEIAIGLNELLELDPQLTVQIFIFNGETEGGDISISKMLYKQLRQPRRVSLIPYDPNPIRTLSRIAKCDYFVAMRFHSCVFAFKSNIPLLIIKYHPKCDAFARTVGLPKKAVISINEIINGKFKEYIKTLQKQPKSFMARTPVRIAKKMARQSVSQIARSFKRLTVD